MKGWIQHAWFKQIDIAPLVSFRILFGAATFISTLRFCLSGWIGEHFIHTHVQFKYFGFEWLPLLSQQWIYLIHILMLLASLGILFGAFYRWSAIIFFVLFTYCELVDITYYLNHYYFVSLVSLMMCIVPANAAYSVDVWRKPSLGQTLVPAWSINIFRAQLIVVYFFAGIAKINYDWLIRALPLKIWLPANDTLPVIGWLFQYDATAYVFSWAGMLFDISVGYFLCKKETRLWAWLVVVFFHLITGWMFQIGVFPMVMIVSTLIFFGNTFHHRLLRFFQRIIRMKQVEVSEQNHTPYYQKPLVKAALTAFFATWFTFQVLFPLRYVLYPGNLYWTEEGYRFSWRVMLMEKAGTATFYVTDATTGKEGVVDNAQFLNPHQEKQLSFQPDLILQYAQFLKTYYEERGAVVSKVRAEVYVTLNARPSRLLISDQQNLLELTDSWQHKNWIIPFETE
ncbi:MAG: HTTM domain-containing protein [Bacteroidota bacterium]